MESVRIHQQKRRNMLMKRTPVGLVVFLPDWLKPSSPQAQTFIAEGIARLGLPPPAVEQTSRAQLRRQVAVWAKRLGVQPGRIQFRGMYRKWGSCSGKGNITLNTALCSVPPDLAEYIVLHELVHLLAFGHGAKFQALMSAHMPDWRERAQRLDDLLGSENAVD